MQHKMIFLIIFVYSTSCVSFGEKFFDVNDLLNVNFMPGSLLLLEGDSAESELFGKNVSNIQKKEEIVTSGSIKEAFNTMGFHRRMMNEYLCRNFVADQILSDMSLTRIRRRLGTAEPVRHRGSNENGNSNKRTELVSIKDTLINDEGSSNYKHWLTKSTTLEDIYRQYEQMQDREGVNNGEAVDEGEEDVDEYEGEVTGFAGNSGSNLGQNVLPPVRGAPPKVGYGGSGQGTGYGHSGYGGSGHSGYGGSGHGGSYEFSPQHIHYHHGDFEEHGKGDKELALGDLFEIALTAIAFLSFGCFILEVIMCITNSTTTTTSAATMMPMMMTMPPAMDNGDDGEDGDDPDSEPVRISHRYKRTAKTLHGNEAINELARRVLLSIESALVVDDDDGNCLKRQLCENNKYSRTLRSNQKIWVPVWSLGMSYVTGKLNSRLPPTTTLLDNLKASILGLGNANCEKIYDNCDLKKLRENRRRRRKKRSA